VSTYQNRYKDKKTGNMKTSAQWSYTFMFDGQRIRESAKTTKRTVARMAEANHRRALDAAAATGKPIGTAKDTRRKRTQRVVAAIQSYCAKYAAHEHEPKGVETVNERAAVLENYFVSDLVVDLTDERLDSYIAKRKADGVGNRTINMERDVLARATGVTWGETPRLKENRDVGTAISPEQEQRLLEVAARSSSRMIHPVLRIALGTGMRRDEIRLLKWNQIDFENREITVGKAKTEKGSGRMIPFQELHAVLTTYAAWVVSKLGLLQQDWYVFPRTNRRKPIDPTRPLGSFKTAWTNVRTKAGVTCRFHDLRHTLCTKMAEAGVAESTMLAIMGHMSKKMLEKYSHIRKQAKRDAIQSIEARSASALSNASVKVLTQVVAVEGSKPS